MKLSTIWTLPGADLKEKLKRTRELAELKAAKRLVPKRVAYWVFILLGTEAIRHDETVPEVRFLDLLNRIPGEPR